MRKDNSSFSSLGRLAMTVWDEQADFNDQKSAPPPQQSHDSPGSEKTSLDSLLEIDGGILPKPVLLKKKPLSSEEE